MLPKLRIRGKTTGFRHKGLGKRERERIGEIPLKETLRNAFDGFLSRRGAGRICPAYPFRLSSALYALKMTHISIREWDSRGVHGYFLSYKYQ